MVQASRQTFDDTVQPPDPPVSASLQTLEPPSDP